MTRFYSFKVITVTSLLTSAFVVVPANAHVGHVGELAGHGHLLGLGLLIGAGIAAAAIARLGKKDREEEEGDEIEAEDGETETSAA